MFTQEGRKMLLALLLVYILSGILLIVTPASAESTDDFVITVKTDNPGTSSDNQFTIPTHPGSSYLYDVDCDNEKPDEIIGATGDATCNYDRPGTYTIRIKEKSHGNGFPRIYFNNSGDKDKIISVDRWGTGVWSSMAYAFYGCSNLAGQSVDTPDLSNVTDMSWMFMTAEAFNQNINGWDTSNVTNMVGMFYGASNFNQELSNWVVSSVTDMSYLFFNASSFNQIIGNWDVSNVDDMSRMFYGANVFNQDIGEWDTSKVKYMVRMFYYATAFNQDIGEWITSNVEDMKYMFSCADIFNQDISDWDTSSVKDMSGMFLNAHNFNQDISQWDVTSLLYANQMFNGAILSTANYDALLIGWDAQNLKPGVTFSGGSSTYCAGESARTHMVSADGWIITDGGKNCPYIIFLPLVNN
jgi:surface protein